ncbi:bifunctional metallophosphatase/5'-nucleotidase [Lutispora thermophila]|uniref:2',3'-cyclic-nucleotide 2'-phosphodiesterase/5'-or 3'-nucleotidase, 5'-nucleotidase family n=1 Tax=Lutispora thermophila DSM 19022 TaxID=1122184 RepID=A0A1M6BEE7_9FIRM|nr:bifunctional UDP-sugar hydrolase/5'-nucleotidase [Lutispora thermophila]SHI47056.1 2',3'-cyclic-nucleotide 2'-phosphodiesterase/5'-or 3'-nucleotidase, 5'-nucleotidase family [Lutispora thermophila DSM 19022]
MNIRILHTNDVHSRFENFAKIVTKVKELKSENTIILDAGDFSDFMRLELQGTNGKAGCSLLNLAAYDAITVGNNEGFAGLDILETMTTSNFVPFISCNLYRSDLSHIKGLKKSIIIDRGGLRFLIIGASPQYNEFFSLLNMHATDYMEEIKQELEENRGKYDISILLSHLGIKEDTEIAQNIDEIDIIIGGHSHTLMEEAEKINGTIIHQSGSYGEHLGVLDIEVVDGKIVNFRGENIKIESLTMDKDITDELLKQKDIAIENLSQPLYEVDRHIWHDVVEENPITNLLADALKDVVNCDFSIINSGILSGGIRKGEVSNKKLLEISPSPLNPTYMEIKGEYIKKALKLSLQADVCLQDGRGSGFRGRYLGRLHVSNNVVIEHNGKNLLKVLIDGEELEEEKTYRIATSDYLQRGTGYPSLANNCNERYNPEYIRDVLRDYLSKKEFVEKCFMDRWKKII